MSIEPSRTQHVISDATCPGCACLCDDLKLSILGDRIVAAEGGCEQGQRWFEQGHDQSLMGPTIRGQFASLDVALDHAADILVTARAPTVCGLADSTIEAQRLAISIADRIGAIVAIGGDDPAGLQAFQRLGEVSASFGEIKDRADLIVYDAALPPSIPERFRERIADNAIGRFTPEGRRGKTVIWLGQAESAVKPDVVIEVSASKQVAFYSVVRAIVNGVEMQDDAVERATGLALSTLIDLADRLKKTTYGVLVLSGSARFSAEREAKLALVRDLNGHTRFVVIHPGSRSPNAIGAKSVLTWQAGAAGDVDFGRGSPNHRPRDGFHQRLSRGEIDAALIVANGQTDVIDESFPRILIHADKVPKVVHPFEVQIQTARLGISEGGSVMRADGVILPLRPPFLGQQITQSAVLRAIEARVITRIQDQRR